MKLFKAICSECRLPILWADREKGDRVECPHCDAKYISGKTLSRIAGTIFHIVCREEEIPIDIDQRKGAVWQVDSGMIFVTCPSCSTLCVADREDVSKDGFVGGRTFGSCIECAKCCLHFWPYLENWKGLKP